MRHELSSNDVQSFRDNGAILLPQLIDSESVERLRAAIDRDIENPAPCYHGYEVDGGGRFHGNMRLWETDADFQAYCCDSILPNVAAQLLGADKIQLYYDQLFVKEAATDAPTRWHNDQPYWPVRGADIMSFWLALDSVTYDSGALEFVKASHSWNKWYQPEPFAVGGKPYARNDDYVDIPDIDAERNQHEFLSWEMEPGDVIAFHALTVHGGPANKSGNRRRGYTVRYCGPDMTYYQGPGTSHFLNDDSLKHGQALQGARYPVVFSGG